MSNVPAEELKPENDPHETLQEGKDGEGERDREPGDGQESNSGRVP